MKSLYILVLLLIQTISISSQDFEIKLKIDKAHTKRKDLIFRSIDKLTENFSNANLRPCYPNAKNPELLLYYTLKGEGDKDLMLKELMSLNVFSEIKEEEIAEIATCFDPIIVNDSLYCYGIDLTQTSCAWTITKGSSDILIGIADTEFDDKHEDLIGKFVRIDNIVPVNSLHGTSVAGIAAALTNNGRGIPGYGYNSKIVGYGIKHSSTGGTSSSEIRQAIWGLYQLGVPIINVSWTTTGLDILAAEEITNNGSTLVLAAGNKPNANEHKFIADVPGVINVTSIGEDNKHGWTGHAHNEWVDICAPGVNIWFPKRGNIYDGGWGTSSAAPAVSGIISLMLDVNPHLTPVLIEAIIKETADPVADGESFPNLLGAGRINAYHAVIKAGSRDYSNTTLSGVKNMSAGYGFNLKNVSIGENSDINLIARKEVFIDGVFEIPLGSSFSIDIDSSVRTNSE